MIDIVLSFMIGLLIGLVLFLIIDFINTNPKLVERRANAHKARVDADVYEILQKTKVYQEKNDEITSKKITLLD